MIAYSYNPSGSFWRRLKPAATQVIKLKLLNVNGQELAWRFESESG